MPRQASSERNPAIERAGYQGHALKRYVIVKAVVVRLRRLLLARRRSRGLVIPALRALLARFLRFVARSEQLQSALHINHDFRGVALHAVFLPFAGLQSPLDVAL